VAHSVDPLVTICLVKGCKLNSLENANYCFHHVSYFHPQKDTLANVAAVDNTSVFASVSNDKVEIQPAQLSRCTFEGCEAELCGNSLYCNSHSGHDQCQMDGCLKAAHGTVGHCLAHCGGKRCLIEGCNTRARGKSGLCIAHGGGRRCQVEGCRTAARGAHGYCKIHASIVRHK